MKRIDAIVTHRGPHIDEICAIWLLRKFGENRFPGIAEADFIFEGSGGDHVNGLSPEELEAEGIIVIGVGGGRFDEHPGVKTFGKENETSSSLVAKELGIENDLTLESILRFVKNSDLKGGNHPFDLGALVKSMHQANPGKDEEVMDWAMEALEAKYSEQKVFLAAKCVTAYATNWEEIPGPNGKIRLAWGISENSKFSAACRAEGAGIVIQRHSSGNTQIYTANKFHLDIKEVVRRIRMAEQQAKGKIVTANDDELGKEGKTAGAEEWYYQTAGQMMLNGTLSCPNAPTHLSLEQIVAIVKAGIRP